MTDFYSTKINKKVNIPNTKVCGYRMENELAVKGYSNGVRTGRDNGVVPQKLSRFATNEEREKAGSNCAGNTNWMNHKVKFNEVNVSKQFNLRRPSFRAGEKANFQSVQMPRNKRTGYGNYNLVRNNFIRPQIRVVKN